MPTRPQVKKKGRRRLNQAVFDSIEKAGKKELVIHKSAWKLRTPPGHHILFQYLKKHYKVQTLANDKGWVVKRV
jgi:hypothetical protein